MRKRTPLYLDSLEAAQKKGREEVDKYLASYKANVRCAEDIKRTIYYYYDGFRLPDGFVCKDSSAINPPIRHGNLLSELS